ncbi:MAG: hypothetical protein EYC70_01380 [Planctomycetota bacterium]|nr:MAG: hypothetical protein EYC70_01380 [Planctomycetota bacterium]
MFLAGLVEAEDVTARILDPRPPVPVHGGDPVHSLDSRQVVLLELHAFLAERRHFPRQVGHLEGGGGVLGLLRAGLEHRDGGALAGPELQEALLHRSGHALEAELLRVEAEGGLEATVGQGGGDVRLRQHEDLRVSASYGDSSYSAAQIPAPEVRQVILLRKLINLSRTEIAREMNRSEDAVTALLGRALARLRELLEAPPQ